MVVPDGAVVGAAVLAGASVTVTHNTHTHTHISKLTQPTTLYFNERYMRPATCTAKARYALKL